MPISIDSVKMKTDGMPSVSAARAGSGAQSDHAPADTKERRTEDERRVDPGRGGEGVAFRQGWLGAPARSRPPCGRESYCSGEDEAEVGGRRAPKKSRKPRITDGSSMPPSASPKPNKTPATRAAMVRRMLTASPPRAHDP